MTARRLVPTLYLALAAYAWIDFIRTNPDGLANVGLMAVTLPITLFGLLLTELMGRGSFVLLPSGFGYQGKSRDRLLAERSSDSWHAVCRNCCPDTPRSGVIPLRACRPVARLSTL